MRLCWSGPYRAHVTTLRDFQWHIRLCACLILRPLLCWANTQNHVFVPLPGYQRCPNRDAGASGTPSQSRPRLKPLSNSHSPTPYTSPSPLCFRHKVGAVFSNASSKVTYLLPSSPTPRRGKRSPRLTVKRPQGFVCHRRASKKREECPSP